MSRSEKIKDKLENLIVEEKKFLDIISYNKIPKNRSKTNKIAPCSAYLAEYFKYEQNNENEIKKKDHLNEEDELHLAAKNGDVNEIKKLINNESKKEARDRFGRTPLYIAAEYGNIEAVKLLLEEKCEINVENFDGQKALFWIIARCRKLAPEILDMEGIFRELDEYFQIDKYYLKKIELTPLDEKTFPNVKSILEYVVEQNDLELISHPVITNFIKFKWNEIRVWSFGKFIIDLIFCVVWNLWGVLKRYDLRHEYDLSNELALLILFIIGILTLIIMMLIEIKEFIDDFKYKKIRGNKKKSIAQTDKFWSHHGLNSFNVKQFIICYLFKFKSINKKRKGHIKNELISINDERINHIKNKLKSINDERMNHIKNNLDSLHGERIKNFAFTSDSIYNEPINHIEKNLNGIIESRIRNFAIISDSIYNEPINHIENKLNLACNDKLKKIAEFLGAEINNISNEISYARDHIRITSIAILFLSIRVFKNARVLWENRSRLSKSYYDLYLTFFPEFYTSLLNLYDWHFFNG
ncbi:transient receptor potential channel pyrexia-like [Brachionus plicatilis]|uniref:Transient receptor potential channel pyrexia-like n=1 Tax=Brachionus plicatilis TaxID=10195 RepID=A0A3M7S2L5_BRAPC|nr:transient receptor potential channel pyrexia-like [Brachionus plicatilis]